MSTLSIIPFFDEQTFTVSYVVADTLSKHCAIIDSVLDFDLHSGNTSTVSADKIIAHIKENQWQCQWIMETHAHADHLTAAPYLQKALGGKVVIGSGIVAVQKTFAPIFNFEDTFVSDGQQFDQLIAQDDSLALGGLAFKILHTPGHTPACMTYVIEDAAFIGDTMFMPDFGTARCDFPGGDAKMLYQSIQKILALPEGTRLFTGHDYKAPGRDQFAWQSTVAEQKEKNIHVNDQTSLEQFVEFRSERDSQLAVPKLLLPAVQVNIRAGHMPPAEADGKQYLKLPINVIGR